MLNLRVIPDSNLQMTSSPMDVLLVMGKNLIRAFINQKEELFIKAQIHLLNCLLKMYSCQHNGLFKLLFKHISQICHSRKFSCQIVKF